MAQILLQANDTRIAALSFEDGAIENVETSLPKEGGVLASRGYVDNRTPAFLEVSGTATFTNSTNNIALTGIGSMGLEVGDVIQITGSTNNNKEFTVEIITDANNIVVNYEHRGGTTTKSLVNETATVTVKRLAKWYNATDGLGQGWCTPTSARSLGATYTNTTGRPIHIGVYVGSTTVETNINLEVDGLLIFANGKSATSNAIGVGVFGIVPESSTYSITSPTGVGVWAELR